MPRERIDTTFHETFALNAPAVAAILRVSDEHEGDVTPEIVRAETQLGPNYVKAMPRYARGCGLLEISSYRLTPFGRAAFENDPNLTRPETLWLMHYHLSAPHGPGPCFWNHLIARHVRIGHTLSRANVSEVIGRFLKESATKTLGTRTLQSTATAFLGTYAKSDGLGKLGLIEDESGSYTVRQPQTPPVWVLACADRKSTRLNSSH